MGRRCEREPRAATGNDLRNVSLLYFDSLSEMEIESY